MRRQGKRVTGAVEGTKGVNPPGVESSNRSEGTKTPAFDADKFRASMDRLFQIYSDISGKADEVMQSRCPYKDARSRCTARFECRNQFFTKNPTEKPVCAGSDRIDYRSAWVDGGAAPSE